MVPHPQGTEAESPVPTAKPFPLWTGHHHGTPWRSGGSPQPVMWPLQRGREKLSRGKGCLQPPFSRLVSVQRAERHKTILYPQSVPGCRAWNRCPRSPLAQQAGETGMMRLSLGLVRAVYSQEQPGHPCLCGGKTYSFTCGSRLPGISHMLRSSQIPSLSSDDPSLRTQAHSRRQWTKCISQQNDFIHILHPPSQRSYCAHPHTPRPKSPPPNPTHPHPLLALVILSFLPTPMAARMVARTWRSPRLPWGLPSWTGPGRLANRSLLAAVPLPPPPCDTWVTPAPFGLGRVNQPQSQGVPPRASQVSPRPGQVLSSSQASTLSPLSRLGSFQGA